MSRIGAYLVSVLVGRENVPGAPVLHFTGVVNAVTGVINGHAEITQSVSPEYGTVEIPRVTGVVRQLGFGPDKQVVTLSGTYTTSTPPPSIAVYQALFEAALVVDKSWNGTGSFSYGQHKVDEVPVRNVSP